MKSVIGNERGAYKSRFANARSQINTNIGNFHSLEVAGRGSETELQVNEKIK